jgi:MoaA/NifB/PqqE/SkfB family radical SAM enzyme
MPPRSLEMPLSETAAALHQAGRREEAVRWYRRALETEPGHAAAIAGLARLLLEERKLSQAVELLRTPGGAAPGDLQLAAVRRDVALTLYAHNLWEEVGDWLAEAAALEPWDLPLAAAARRTRRPDYLAPAILDPLSGRELERTAAREGEAYIFVIDIAGTCNLRCPTCPVGNSERGERPIGFMPPEMFEKIVAKIKRESPSAVPIINLYNWGEPLLHPDLPAFIQLLRREGMRANLSSNLNIKRGLEDVIAADPHELKISLSGFSPASYARTHARGDLELVKENMRRVAEYRTRHKASTRVWVGHHIYKSNRHEIEDVRRLCTELGFEHHPMEAFYMPLERLMDVYAGKPNPRDGGILDDLITHPMERRRAGPRSGRYDCELRFNQTVINHDGKVALCCTVYEQPNMLGAGFLDESFADIEARKYRHSFCTGCYREGLEYAPRELPAHGKPPVTGAQA